MSGCGPGVLTVELADRFNQVDRPRPRCRDAGGRSTPRRRQQASRIFAGCRRAREDIPTLDLGTFKLVTFGQSFHWTDREQVAEAVYDILEPGGALALISHAHAGTADSPPALATRRFPTKRSARSSSATWAAPARRPGLRGAARRIATRMRLRAPVSARRAACLRRAGRILSGISTTCWRTTSRCRTRRRTCSGIGAPSSRPTSAPSSSGIPRAACSGIGRATREIHAQYCRARRKTRNALKDASKAMRHDRTTNAR